MIICPKCGASLPDDSRFCGSCGESLQAQPAPQMQTPTEPQYQNPTYQQP